MSFAFRLPQDMTVHSTKKKERKEKEKKKVAGELKSGEALVKSVLKLCRQIRLIFRSRYLVTTSHCHTIHKLSSLFSPYTLYSHSSSVGQGLGGNNRIVFLIIITFLCTEMHLRVLTWYFPRLSRPTCFQTMYSLVTFTQTVNCHVTWRHNGKRAVRSLRDKQRKHATLFWNLYGITLRHTDRCQRSSSSHRSVRMVFLLNGGII